MVVGFVSVIFDAISPDKVFLFLVNSSGAVALFVYLLIAAAQLRMRRQLERDEPERLTLRMWGFPWLTYLSMAAIVVVIVSMAFVDDVRSQLPASLGSLAVVGVAAWWRGRSRARERRPAPAGRAGSAQPSRS